MLCTNCGNKEAVFHYKQIINGVRSEQHLCTDCAMELGYANQGENTFDFSDMFNNFISIPSFLKPSASVRSCQNCGTTFEEFKKTGLLGCDKCYDEFKNIIESTLAQIQPATSHKGKLSGESGKKIQFENELNELKEQLKRAIIDEKYEDAAVYRDKIKELEETEEKDNG